MSIRKEITEHFREAIITGVYRPGDMLPSTSEIAERFSSQKANVQRALTRLVHEGLITREPRIGTFVREQKRELSSVAIYVENALHGLGSPYRRYLLESLERKLGKLRLKCRIVIDNAEGAGRAQLRRLAESGRIQAVLFVDLAHECIRELSKLPVPLLGISPTAAVPHVSLAGKSRFYPELARAFAAHGCRRVGVIGTISRQPMFRDADEEAQLSFAEISGYFHAAGVEIDERTVPEFPATCDFNDLERAGFLRARELLELPGRPDGLLVLADPMLPGVVAAAYHCDLRFEDAFRLVAFQQNRELPRVFPSPAMILEYSLEELADALIQLLKNCGNESGTRRIYVYPKLYMQEN